MIGPVEHFHFLRPLWFLALVPLAALLVLLWRRESTRSAFRDLIDQSLLPHLLLDDRGRARRSPLVLLGAAWLITVLALAGPVWQKQPQPVFSIEESRVIVLDLSRSMLMDDLAPSRLERARYKLRDLLAHGREGRTGLVVFSGDAHVVVPLTDDIATIEAMLASLSPEIMPREGDVVGGALGLAMELLARGGQGGGNVILLSDGIGDGASAMGLLAELRGRGHRLSVLGLVPDGADPGPLPDLARAGGGVYSPVSGGEADLDRLLASGLGQRLGGASEQRDSAVERWYEEGPWLLLPLLALAALAGRRGWLLAVALLLLLPPRPAQALEWRDLWQSADQRASARLEAGDAAGAAELFTDPGWRGTAQFDAGDFQVAADSFAELENADGFYNQGNALAKFGRLEDAVAAYDRALELDSAMEDARVNRDLVKNYLEQQQKSQCNNLKPGDDDQDKNGQNQQEPNQEENNGQGKEQSPPEERQGQQAENGKESEERQGPEEKAAQDQEQAVAGQEPQPPEATEEGTDQAQAMAKEDEKAPPSEEELALETWLGQVPDDPAGLLRRKFQLETERRMHEGGQR